MQNYKISRKVLKIECFLFSDITIHLDGHQVRAHRFVLSIRSTDWGVPDLTSADRLEFKGFF